MDSSHQRTHNGYKMYVWYYFSFSISDDERPISKKLLYQILFWDSDDAKDELVFWKWDRSAHPEIFKTTDQLK